MGAGAAGMAIAAPPSVTEAQAETSKVRIPVIF